MCLPLRRIMFKTHILTHLNSDYHNVEKPSKTLKVRDHPVHQRQVQTNLNLTTTLWCLVLINKSVTQDGVMHSVGLLYVQIHQRNYSPDIYKRNGKDGPTTFNSTSMHIAEFYGEDR